MRDWILGIFSASLLSAVALALCPEGRVRAVTRMVCGIVCALAVASPLLSINADMLAADMARYAQQAEKISLEGEEERKMLERTYIEEECSAYICAKAAQTGAAISGASVLARWDEDGLVWYPWSVTVKGAYDPILSNIMEGDLGVPAERQEWLSDG